MSLAYNATQQSAMFIAAPAVQLTASEAQAQTLNGIRVGDPPATLQALKLPQVFRMCCSNARLFPCFRSEAEKRVLMPVIALSRLHPAAPAIIVA